MTSERKMPYDIWAENMSRIAELSHLVAMEWQRIAAKGEGEPSPFAEDFGKVWEKIWMDAASRPEEWLRHGMELWCDWMEIARVSYERALGADVAFPFSYERRDRRFSDEEWSANPFFAGLRHMYLRGCESMREWAYGLCGDDEKMRRRYDFYVSQYLEAISPSNFVATNPAAMREFIASHGASLVKGMENMLGDLRATDRHFHINLSPPNAFTPGKNIAISPGDVVYRNYLMEIIRYKPKGPTVAAVPLLLIPAWINKYYIFDLSEDKSFVRWCVERGFDVYVISWANPDARMAGVTFDDYLIDGALAALDFVRKHSGSKRAALMGYCLGGTLLACLMAYLAKKGRAHEALSASFLTTLLDFSDTGDFSVFLDADKVRRIESQMLRSGGLMDGKAMANIFSLIRANDLIWNFVVNNYLLGKEPAPFDILHWNADVTNLPAAMHSFYLKNMYVDNKLMAPNALSLAGTPMDLGAISVPSYFLAAKEDHIAPWQAVFNGCKLLLESSVTFVLAGSGHVAGVINPPAKQKYGYATSPSEVKTAEEWAAKAVERAGSWWENWEKWQRELMGEDVRPARENAESLAPAPGDYVRRSHAVTSE
ncbi:MAG: class I poly(R)-hydroxyalkanoic acid synthase [Rickettsiales bacterium]